MAAPFHALVERLAAIEYEHADEGDERIHISPPATPAQLDELRRRIGGPLPDELRQLCEVTTGFSGRSSFDVAPETSFRRFDDPGFGASFQVYDYGNGDGLWFEPSTNELWWFGHDPYDVIFVGASLLDYVRACVEYAEAIKRQETADDADEPSQPYEPLVSPEPVAFADAPREIKKLVHDVASPAWVWDLRDAAPRTEANATALWGKFGRWARRGRIFVMSQPPHER